MPRLRSFLRVLVRQSIGIVAAVASTAILSCTVPATQILVSIDTDFYVPSEVDTVRVRVLHETDRAGGPDETRAFQNPPGLVEMGEVVLAGRVHEPRLVQDFPLGPSQHRLPLELSLVPRSGDPSRPVRVEAYALRAGVVRATASLRARFVRHTTARLPLVIYVACATVACLPDETCGPGGACVPNERTPDCVTDPLRCPDARVVPPDAARDVFLQPEPDASLDGGAPVTCGDGVWAPELEQCDGTPDCGQDCRLIAPRTEGTCVDPIVLPSASGTWTGSFVGHIDEVRPISRFFSTVENQRGREVVYAIDLDSPATFQARTGTGTSALVTTECPTTGPTPRVTGGATGSNVIAEGAIGRLYVIVDETARTGGYDRDYMLEFVTPGPVGGVGTCDAPSATRPAGLLRFLEGSEPSAYEPLCGGRMIPAATREIFFDAEGFGGARTLWAAASDTTPAIGWIGACGEAAVDFCAQTAPSHPEFARVYRVTLSGASGSRFFVDGLGPRTQWVALWID